MRKKIALSIFALLSISIIAQNNKVNFPYKESQRSIDERIEDLLSRMTLEEKVLQINQYILGKNDNPNNISKEIGRIPSEIGSLIYFSNNVMLRNQMQRKAIEESRLSIPILFGYDVIHGFKTIYPIPLAQACSWNPELVKQACSVAAQEARMSGVDWTFSPMIDVARDGRWGRVAEGYGEDSYTNAIFGEASVKGYQGDNLSDGKNVAACLKHYVGYGASEGGRDYVYTEISQQTLWDTYLYPFEKGVQAGASAVMSAFNDISGIPASANYYTLTEILKNRWQYKGLVVSDWGAIEQLQSQGIASDKKEATLKAFQAGVDMDMMSKCYDTHLAELVNEDLVSMNQIDNAVRRVLYLKFKLGLFENPYTKEFTEKERFLLPKSIEISEKLAEESIVLLKNENKTLPLSNVSKIAVLGPMAKDKMNLLGSWPAHGNESDITSIYEGLETEFKDRIQLFYAKGCSLDGSDKSGFQEAIEVVRQADIAIVCLGEFRNWSGENASRSTLALPQIQEDLVYELKKAGKPIILLLSNGRPLELNRLETICDAIIEIWHPGIAGGKPVAGILSGRINPSGKLSITFPYSTGQIPIYYNHRKSARPNIGKYQDMPSTPLYDFGHGLSYTTFEYGELKISSNSVKIGDNLKVEIPVTNIGEREGMEIVHWFISDPVSSISRPVKELRHFDKQTIKAGETRIFRFDVNIENDLSFIDKDGKRFVETGDYYIKVKDKSIKVKIIE